MNDEEQKWDTVAHDLRNALSVIYSSAQLLELLLKKSGTEEEQKIASQLVESAAHMDTLITEKLQVEK